MNEAFLRFWSFLFQQAARSPAQMEALAKFMAAGAHGLTSMAGAMERFFPGITTAVPGAGDAAAVGDYFKQFFDGFNLVPRSQLDKAMERCGRLEEKLTRAQARIEKLSAELAACRLARGDAIAGYTALVKVQQHQFEKLTASIGQLFGAGTGKHEP
jgi:hypothetical protein